LNQVTVIWNDDLGGKKSRGAKMQVLRKQLEETKARQVGIYKKVNLKIDFKKNLIRNKFVNSAVQLAEASNRKDLEDIVMNLQKELCKAGPEVNRINSVQAD
jgi:hypothetical protein